jgi:hypothetical protein
LLSESLLPCRRYHPARAELPYQPLSVVRAAFVWLRETRPPELVFVEATYAFTFVTAWQLAVTLAVTLSIDSSTISFPRALPSELRGFGYYPGRTNSC